MGQTYGKKRSRSDHPLNGGFVRRLVMEMRTGEPAAEEKTGDSDAWAANQLLSLLDMGARGKGAGLREKDGVEVAAPPKSDRAASGKTSREGSGSRKAKKAGSDDGGGKAQAKDEKKKKETAGGRRVNRPTHNHSKESKAVLRGWFYRNLDNPYPSEDLKRFFAQQTGLNQAQIATFFTNERKRYPNPPWWDRSKTAAAAGRNPGEGGGGEGSDGGAARKDVAGSHSEDDGGKGDGGEGNVRGVQVAESPQVNGGYHQPFLSSAAMVASQQQAGQAREGVDSILGAAGVGTGGESRGVSAKQGDEGKHDATTPESGEATGKGKRIKKRPRTDDELDGGPAYPSGGGQHFQITTTGRGGRWEEEGSGPRSGRKKAVKRASVSPLEPPAKPWLNLSGKIAGGSDVVGADAGAGDVSAASVLLGSSIMSSSVVPPPSAQSIVVSKQDVSATLPPGPATDVKVVVNSHVPPEKNMTAAAVLLSAKPGEEGGAIDTPCVMCSAGVKTWCVMPCGHKALCEKCAHAYFETVPRPFHKCPLCQAEVKVPFLNPSNLANGFRVQDG